MTSGGIVNLATPTPSATLGRNKSTSAATTSSSRGSFGPNWPLGPRNPLAAHPVDANLKKRLSDSRLGTMSLAEALTMGPRPGLRGPDSDTGMRAEGSWAHPLKLSSTPPPPGSKHVPPKSPGAGLRSPRLEFVPVSPIVGRIEDEEEEEDGGRDVGEEPVSPIDSDDAGFEGDAQRLSYVSAPSANFDADDLVSPVSPRHGRDDDDEDEGQESLRTVSPLESRRGSVVS